MDLELVSENLEGLPLPPIAWDAWLEVAELVSLKLLLLLGRPYLEFAAEKPPVFCGLTIPALLVSPIALENRLG